MKRHFTLLLFTFAMALGSAFAQTTGFTLSASDSAGCANELVVAITIGPNVETGGIVTIDWGDGSGETFPYSTGPGQTNLSYGSDHGYAITGTYIVTVDIFSGTAGAPVGSPQTLSWNVFDPSNCGYAYIGTYSSAPSINYSGAPYDFTGADGITTTIYPTTYYYQGLNIANAPYLVSINDAWLSANGLVQTSSDVTINSFYSGGMGNPGQLTFAVTCSVGAPGPDFGTQYTFGSNFVAPLQAGQVMINLCNFGCADTSDAQLTLTFDPVLTPNTSGLLNAVTSPGTLTFDLPDFTGCDYLVIPFTFPGSTSAGTLLTFTSTISAVSETDTDPSNNIDTFTCIVVNSYDPNDKHSDKPTNINPGETETLQYVINFQNEGNFPALDVVVQDTISTNLDLSTFQLLGAKHGVATSVNTTTRVVTFSFDNINLDYADNNEEASKGFVVYSIQENAGLPVNSEIENMAYIYFDFNPAIVTNTAYNINAEALGLNETALEQIVLFPNPATSVVRFLGADISGAQIYDVTGKLVGGSENLLSNELSVAGLSNGIYHVVISTAKGVQSQKLVIRN